MIRIVVAGPDKFKEVLAIWNPVWPEYASDEDEMLHRDGLDDSLRSRYWLAYSDTDDAVGLLEISSISGSYHPRRWTVSVAVQESSRRCGIGRQLYDFGCEVIAPSKPLSIITHVREGDEGSIRFAAARGFVESKRDFISVLDLTSLDRILIDNIISNNQLPDLRIVRGEEIESPSFRRALHALFEEVRQDIPRSFPATPLTLEQFEGGFLDPSFHWRCSMFAMDGDVPVGFSTGFEGPTEKRLLQGLTGVARSHRGKGLAKTLKAHLVSAAIAEGYDSIATDNDTRNAPMLAINNQFGFQRQPGTIHYLWSADGP